jgi:hypothetical protein
MAEYEEHAEARVRLMMSFDAVYGEPIYKRMVARGVSQMERSAF